VTKKSRQTQALDAVQLYYIEGHLDSMTPAELAGVLKADLGLVNAAVSDSLARRSALAAEQKTGAAKPKKKPPRKVAGFITESAGGRGGIAVMTPQQSFDDDVSGGTSPFAGAPGPAPVNEKFMKQYQNNIHKIVPEE
jgi:hypothetical protein